MFRKSTSPLPPAAPGRGGPFGRQCAAPRWAALAATAAASLLCAAPVAAQSVYEANPLPVPIAPPAASGLILLSNAVGVAPFVAQFDAAAQPQYARVVYSWDFGDGATATLKNPSHLYAKPGTYKVSLTTVGYTKEKSGGVKEQAQVSVRVGAPLSADLSQSGLTKPGLSGFGADLTGVDAPLLKNAAVGPTILVTPRTVGVAPFAAQFDATPSRRFARVTYLWDFGTGATSTLKNPAYTFTTPGTYTVTLTTVGYDIGIGIPAGVREQAQVTIRVVQASAAVVNLPWDWDFGSNFIGANFNGLLNLTVAPNGDSTHTGRAEAKGKIFYVPVDVFRANAVFNARQQTFSADVKVYVLNDNVYNYEKTWPDFVDETASNYVEGSVLFFDRYFDIGPVDVELAAYFLGQFGVSHRFYATGGGHTEANVIPYADAYAYLIGYGAYGTYDNGVEGYVEGLFRIVGEEANFLGKVDLGNDGAAYADIAWDIHERTNALNGRVDATVVYWYYGFPFPASFNIWRGDGFSRDSTLTAGSQRFYLPTYP